MEEQKRKPPDKEESKHLKIPEPKAKGEPSMTRVEGEETKFRQQSQPQVTPEKILDEPMTDTTMQWDTSMDHPKKKRKRDEAQAKWGNEDPESKLKDERSGSGPTSGKHKTHLEKAIRNGQKTWYRDEWTSDVTG